jgi:phospholipid/cholesterol/gamma-HCH transport system substrate-binding protein
MDRLLELWQSKVVRFVLAGVVLIAAVVVGIEVTKGDSTYQLNAVYASAPGLFPGAAVDVLGVPVGTVTTVKNVADHVEVGMAVKSGTRIPRAALASLVAPEVLGQPDVDLNPGYTGGAYLHSDATIPESQTSVPVSTDQLLKQLQRTLDALNPHAVGDLITNLSEDLDGQGAGLNQLIASAAGTIQLLANKGDDLGQLNGTLAQVTGTLDSDTSQIEQLVQEYDTVSTVLAQHSSQLNDAITQLAGASTSLVTLLTPNLQPLEADVGTVTTAGRTLDRNIANVDEILQQANNLFEGAQRVFDPDYNWLDLNLALPVGVTGDYVVGLIRDRLAGVCRRIAANHGSGLSQTVLNELQSCGNPNSTFFNPLISAIPGILSTLSGSPNSTTESTLLQQGLNKIQSLGAGSGSTSAGTAKSATANGSATAPSAASTTTTTTTPGATSSCGLLGLILGCSGAPKSAGSKASGGLGGLLSEDVASTTSPKTTVHLASDDSGGPSLTAPAAADLPPLPSAHHAHRVHRGLLSGWIHDVAGWL